MIQLDNSQTSLNMNTTASELVTRSQISPWLARIVYPVGKYVVLPLFFGKMVITGQENIPRTGPLILAPTHRSRWDAIVVPHATGRLVSGRDMRYMVSANEIQGLQGWFIKRLGGFPVDTNHPGSSSVRRSVEILGNEEMLVIFPEGGIFRNKTVQPLKEGIGRIALQAQIRRHQGESVKVLPISVRYSQDIPSWGSEVNVDIGLPIDVAQYGNLSTKQGAKKLTADLELALKELHEVNVPQGTVSMQTN